MKKIGLIISVLILLLAWSSISYADRHGHHGGWEGSVYIAPFPYLYPAYPPPYYSPYPTCERVCTERLVPVCREDRWGERWCHDEIVRDCRRVCY